MRLYGYKAIAEHLSNAMGDTSPSTARSYRGRGMPVHEEWNGRVYGESEEIDAWVESQRRKSNLQ